MKHNQYSDVQYYIICKKGPLGEPIKTQATLKKQHVSCTFFKVTALTYMLIFSVVAVADPEAVQGNRLNPLPAPVFKYPMKMKQFGLSEGPNYFIFMGYLRKNKIKSSMRTSYTFIRTPFLEFLDPSLCRCNCFLLLPLCVGVLRGILNCFVLLLFVSF